MGLMMLANPKWERANHLRELNKEFLEIYNKLNDRLMVFMPPGHGKSSLGSETLPSWWLGHRPDDRVMFVSYEHDFAAGKGRACRDLFREYAPPVFNLELNKNIQSADEWGVEDHRGLMWSAGVGGPLTGKRANLIIIDDPVKNQEQAESPTYREKSYNWYITTLRTRLEPGGAIIIIMTRWHEDDLAGRLLRDETERQADKWKVISFPAIAEGSDILGRKQGEALWPHRFPLEHLEATKRANPPRYWASLYQQNPRPDEGNMFKNKYFRYYRVLDLRNPHPDLKIAGDLGNGTQIFYELNTPEGIKYIDSAKCILFQTIDTAATEKTYSDYFVVATWAMTPERDLLLRDIYREQAETTKHLDILSQQRIKWNPRFQGVEKKTYGLSLIQSARIMGFPIKELEADVDKVSRALTMKARYEMGTVYHLINAPWLYDYESELTMFPNATHDDMVDCAAYAGILLGTMPMPRFVSMR